MGSRLPVILSALALAACSTLKVDEAALCRGERRPANPFGSVLAPATEPPPPSPITGGCGVQRP